MELSCGKAAIAKPDEVSTNGLEMIASGRDVAAVNTAHGTGLCGGYL